MINKKFRYVIRITLAATTLLGAQFVFSTTTAAATTATTSPDATWQNLVSARVVNLFSNASPTPHAKGPIQMVSAVSESSTYGMMLLGLGMIGTIARRRKNYRD